MNTIDSLNVEYTENTKVRNTLQLYYDKISRSQISTNTPRTKLLQSLALIKELQNEFDCSSYSQFMDTVTIVESYIACIDAIEVYKDGFLKEQSLDKNEIIDAVKLVLTKQNNFNALKDEYENKYNYKIKSEDSLIDMFSLSMRATINLLEKRADRIRIEAKQINNKESIAIEISPNDAIIPAEFLPSNIFIGKYSDKQVPAPLFKDTGISQSEKYLLIELRNQGNIFVDVAYDQMDVQLLDNFIISYIFKYIEAFPLGTVNVHIFARNANYLYKRLCNSFQTSNAGEETKQVIQLHKDLNDIIKLKDVICEDIFSKIQDNPDLYSVYDEDINEVFNLIILREGVVTDNGYGSADILDVIKYLSNPNDIGHKCGVRFLIADNSSSLDSNRLNSNTLHTVNQIKNNCATNIEFVDGNFILNGTNIEVIHMVGDLEVTVQQLSSKLASVINSKKKNSVTIDEVFSDSIEEIDSIMRIPIGKSGKNVVDLPLSCKDEGGTVEGRCIGYMVIGQSGSGKSSLFHSIVLNGCMKYSPKDLQFWLLDFKNGGASSKYRYSGLPHIKLIAENNKVDDAMCLFQMVLEEMDRRSKIFNKNNTDNIIDYNKIALENNSEYFPRIIVAIDEVQEIFRDEDMTHDLQRQISSISSRMRSFGIHFIMVAQNLSEGKSYMLKESFLPSITGRVCFRVAEDIVRDAGFGDDFAQRESEIKNLKTGEAYIGYGIDTIKRVKIAYTTPQEMNDKLFNEIKDRYRDYSYLKPLVIGSKERLTIVTALQGRSKTYFDETMEVKSNGDNYFAIIGEDAYRMTPLKIPFSPHEKSSIILCGNDKQISSSLCTSVAISLLSQDVEVHLFNGDLTKIRDGENLIQHSFMYCCQKFEDFNGKIVSHQLRDFTSVIGSIYVEYLKRRDIYYQTSDRDNLFKPMFLIVNDLFAIKSFEENEELEDLENIDAEEIQTIILNLLKTGWRYNIHLVLAIRDNLNSWYGFDNGDANSILLFNDTDAADNMDNPIQLKEMLKNISNEFDETMAVWSKGKSYSKIRPIIYDMSDSNEKMKLDILIERANNEKTI